MNIENYVHSAHTTKKKSFKRERNVILKMNKIYGMKQKHNEIEM